MDNKPNIAFRGLNVRGLQNYTKRQNMFDWLKGKHLDIPKNIVGDVNMLSETHCHLPQIAKKWGREWSDDPNNSLFSLGSSNKKGVAILINDRLKEKYPDLKISHVKKRFKRPLCKVYNDCE